MDQLPQLVSASVAVVATVVSLFLLRQGQGDRRVALEAKLREQARQVTAWADWHSDPELATFGRPRWPAIFVRNSSGAVVFDVFVDYRMPADGAWVRASIGPVPPGETRLHEVDGDPEPDQGWEPAALFPRINFRDSNGSRWLRDAAGRLRKDPGVGKDGFFEAGGVLLPNG